MAATSKVEANDPVNTRSESAGLELTVVMPCLNEAETLETCIRRAHQAIADANIAGEVLIADNGSTDSSIEIAERLGARVVRVTAKGYGNALMGGIAAAGGKYVVMGDADASYDFAHIPRFLGPLREGADLVMGNRFLGGIEKGAMPPTHQYFGNPALTWLGRLFFAIARWEILLRAARIPERRISTHGPAYDRDGVRYRDGGEGDTAGFAHC